jgi:hypothetical protein
MGQLESSKSESNVTKSAFLDFSDKS